MVIDCMQSVVAASGRALITRRALIGSDLRKVGVVRGWSHGVVERPSWLRAIEPVGALLGGVHSYQLFVHVRFLVSYFPASPAVAFCCITDDPRRSR